MEKCNNVIFNNSNFTRIENNKKKTSKQTIPFTENFYNTETTKQCTKEKD